MEHRKHLNSICVSHRKNTASCHTETMSVPAHVRISMSQHIGAPCKPLVGKGDYVEVGQKIGDTDAFVSAPIHSSVSGTVTDIRTIRSITGGKDQIIEIETDGEQKVCKEIAPPQISSREEFIKAIRESGLVGLGGASFPTHIKLNPENPDEVNTLVVNGAECEPFITSDHRLMLENANYIIDGIMTVMQYLEIEKACIGVEDNKPDAIKTLNETIEKKGKKASIEVITLRSRYPQGAERVLIYETTGRILHGGKLPAEVGVIVCNITTIAFIGQYMKTGRPLTTKRITVDGNAVAQSKNIIVPIGACISDVVEACGGYACEPEKILMGGPMMGRAVYSDQFPVVKNNNAILVLDKKQAAIPQETGCIKCGACHRACPFNLLPAGISAAYESKNDEKLKTLNIMQCMECGSCSYICPAKRPLSFTNRLAKLFVKEMEAKHAEQ